MKKIKSEIVTVILCWNLFCIISNVDSAQISTGVEIWHTMIELIEKKKRNKIF